MKLLYVLSNSVYFCPLQIRFFTNTFTLTPYNGAEALVWKHGYFNKKKTLGLYAFIDIINIYFAFLHFSQHWLFLQKPECLDPRAKYHSLTSGFGTNYTQPRQVGASTIPP